MLINLLIYVLVLPKHIIIAMQYFLSTITNDFLGMLLSSGAQVCLNQIKMQLP